jgi:RimJ/RimL family protein N-acetyltransferase
MYDAIKSNGWVIGSSDHWMLDSGILLENDDEIIAGAFFNLNKIKSSILILVIFVDEKYRQNGIYKKLHSLIDEVGKQENRQAVYSYIHVDNKLMNEHIMEKIGYEPVMQLVKRPIRIS